jgi:hypothetical protein
MRYENLVEEWQVVLDKKEAPVLEESLLSIISEPATRLVALYSLLTNFIMVYQTYYIAMRPKNIDNAAYKVVIAVEAIAIISLYLISYSTMNYSLYFNGGKGTNLRFENLSTFGSILLFFHLTFMAPVEFVLLEIFTAFALSTKVVVMILTSPFGKGAYKAYTKVIDRMFEMFFGFDKAQIDIFAK